MVVEAPIQRYSSELFTETEEPHWNLIEPSIWTRNCGRREEDTALSIARTLLDQPRWLEARFLYDNRGSHLFEKICMLPEYYLTRTEDAILRREASGILELAEAECIVELGAGFSKKTIHLLKEQLRCCPGNIFIPVDVSQTALRGSLDIVRSLFPTMGYYGLLAPYHEGLQSLRQDLSKLVAFLGSSIGNFGLFDLKRFFQMLSKSMAPGDYLLLGVDRVKDVRILESAYSDQLGVTAEFILNAFCNLNCILGANFDLELIDYYSRYNSQLQQMEMFGVSLRDQNIYLDHCGANFRWRRGERILVEISRKFEPDRLGQQLDLFGFDRVVEFTDPQQWYSLLMFRRSSRN